MARDLNKRHKFIDISVYIVIDFISDSYTADYSLLNRLASLYNINANSKCVYPDWREMPS